MKKSLIKSISLGIACLLGLGASVASFFLINSNNNQSYVEVYATWSGEGTGTESDPYLIGTKAELEKFRDIVNGSNGETQNLAACAKLTANINLEGDTDHQWTPIGNGYSNRYIGTFDGDNYTIDNLYISQSGNDLQGLFGITGSGVVVKNITIKGEVTGHDHVGGLVGNASQGGTFQVCTNYASVSGRGYAGGLIGIVSGGSSTTIENCINHGSVTVDTYGAGGIAGGIIDTTLTMDKCFNTNDITATDYTAGGIAGWISSNATVSNVYNTGSISASYKASGIVAQSSVSGSTISNCHNVGSVSITDTSKPDGWGAILGENENTSTTVSNAYYLSTSASQAGEGGGTSLTADQMKLRDSFSGFEFSSNYWDITNDSYPTFNDKTFQYILRLWDFTNKVVVNAPQTCESYKYVTSSTTSWTNGSYVVDSDVTISSRISVTGTVNLILCDGKTLTAKQGIEVLTGNALTIHGQSKDTGKIIATGPIGEACIGGNDVSDGGSINIQGGWIEANIHSGNISTGIGGGYERGFESIVIYGGTVVATGSRFAPAIGSQHGSESDPGTITIYGGEVIAEGGENAAAIGGGPGGYGESVTISGGSVMATGGANGSGIGIGSSGTGGTISITGGRVTAKGGSGGAGIGGETISISGGQLNAAGVGDNAAGIGSGNSASGPSVNISGGQVTATGVGDAAVGIGRAVAGGNHGSLTVENNLPVYGGSSSESLSVKTDYATSRWKYMKVGNFHTHNFISYSASGNVITATCDNADGNCPLTNYQATLTISAPSVSLIYDGTAKEATYTDTSSGTAFSDITPISYTKGGTPIVGSPIDAGTYVAAISCNEGIASIEYTISKADASLTAPTAKTGLVYTGSAQALVNAGSATGGTIWYKLGTDGTYTESIPTATDAGTYNVYYKVIGDANHNGIAETGPIEVTISEGVASITNGTTVTYYTDFSTALANWDNGTTLTLYKNLNLSSEISVSSGSKTFNLNGYTISGDGNNHTIFFVDGGSLTINGDNGILTGGTGHLNESYKGGALHLASGNVTVNSCNFVGNTAQYGGAIYLAGGTITLNDCKLYDNTATSPWNDEDDGAIFAEGKISNASVIVNGGEIYSHANDSGIVLAGWEAHTSSAQLNGVNIHNNSQCGVNVRGDNAGRAAISVSGNTIIENNTQGNLRLDGNSASTQPKVSVASQLGNNASIGITMTTKGVFTNSTDVSLNDVSKFYSDDTDYVVGKNTDGQLFLGTPVTATYEVVHGTWVGGSTDPIVEKVASGGVPQNVPTGMIPDTGYNTGKWDNNPSSIISSNTTFTYTFGNYAASVTNGETVTYYENFSDALTAWNSASSGATLTLFKDVTTGSSITISGNKILDLNGFGIRASGTGYNVIIVNSGNYLTINDSDPTHAHAITLSGWRGTSVSDGTGTTSVDSNGNGTAYITGGYITGGKITSGSKKGACIYINGGTVDLNKGSVIGNYISYDGCDGGGIFADNTGKFTMYGGSIRYNYSGNSGGGIGTDHATIEINGGVISFNRNNWSGGGAISIYNESTLKLYGGVIENNVSRHADGAICFKSANETLRIKGSPIVRNNTAIETGNVLNLFLNTGVVATLDDPLTTEADIHLGIISNTTRVFTDGWSTKMAGKDPADYFLSDNANYSVYLKTNEAYYGETPAAKVKNGTAITYYDIFSDAVSAWNSADAGATLTLLKDATISTAIEVTDTSNKVIDLNGFTLSGTPGTKQAIVYVNGGTVTINGNGGTLCNGSGYYNSSYTRGGAVAVYANGTNMGNVTIKDCNITENSANFGGAIFVSKGTTATLNNCNVFNNDSSRAYGILGAIYVEDVGATVNVNGGEIYNNDAGIYLWGSDTKGSKANLNGVYIHDNDNYGVRADGNDNGNPVLTIAGNTIIKNNSTLASPEAPGNLRINNTNNAKVAIVSELGDNASIGVTLTGDDKGIFTDGWSTYMEGKDPADYFFSDNLDYSIYLKDGEACLGTGHTVTFNTNGRGIAPDPVMVDHGSLVNKPTDPTVEGYELKGWYKEAECENIWDFDNDTVTEDITLYALWDYDAATANVIKLINDIGTLTYDGGSNDSLADILAAKTAYDTLTPGRKEIVNGVNKDILDHDVTTYRNVDKVGDLIKAIPEPNPTKEYYDAIDLAITEYNKLTEEEVTILNSVINYQKFLNDNIAARKVIIEIEEIGEVTYDGGIDDSKKDIEKAEKSYDELSKDQKDIVDYVNHDVLVDDREIYDQMAKAIKAIKEIGKVVNNEETKKKIEEARKIYDSLPEELKEFVKQYDDSLKVLEDDEKVLDVLVLIDDIGDVNYDSASQEKIQKARTYYESLTDDQKRLIAPEAVERLEEKEATYSSINNTGISLLVVFLIISGLLLIAGLIVMYFIIRKKKEDNGDDNNDNSSNKSKTMKLASFTGLMPFIIYASHYLDSGYILLYIIIALTVIVWLTNLVLFILKKKGLLNKKKEEVKPVETAKEPEPVKPVVIVKEPEPVNEEEEEEIVTITDEKGNIFNIRYIKSFTAKLIQSPEETKKYYEELKNYVLSYKKTTSRVSWHYDSINNGRNQVLKFAIRGKTLCVYYPLNASDYEDSKYKVEAVDSKKFEEVPCLYRIKNDRRLGYAKDLIDTVMTNLGLVKGEEQHEVYSNLPYEENRPLIARGLIKEQKIQVNKPVEQVVSKKVNDEGDEIVTTRDAKGNIFEIRYIKSFTAKLSQASEEVKDYYNELKNYALSYKKANSRVSWHFDSINVGRNQVIKFSIRGKTLCVYYALNANDYLDTKYKVEVVESKKFEEVPCLYRIKNDRRRDYAKDLIDTVMANVPTEKGKESNEDFRIPYESTKALLAKGLIKENKVQVNKPVEDKPVEQMSEEEEEVITITDEKGNIFNIRYIKSFTAKLIQSPEETKAYYEELKNYVLSYKKTTSRVSWHYDSINSGRNQVIKFSIRGKTLCVYYPLNANDYLDTKYKVEAVESKKFEEVPCLYRIKNDRRLGYAKDLIDTVMTNLGLVKGEEQHEVYSDLPYEPNKPLIDRGLIKELKVQVIKPVAPVVIKAEEVDVKMSDEEAASQIKEDTGSNKHIGKKGIVNIDVIAKSFANNEVVNIESLWKKKIISKNIGHVKVLARGSLDKKLNIELQDYSLQAVKMILLMGGTVKRVK